VRRIGEGLEIGHGDATGERLLAPLQAADAEDLADRFEVVGGSVNESLPKIEEFVGLHRAELVADDVAEGARLAARGGLLDAGLSQRPQDVQLVGRESSMVWDSSCKQRCVIPAVCRARHFQLDTIFRDAPGFQYAARQSRNSRLLHAANARRYTIQAPGRNICGRSDSAT
jgi:hypothetical protein